MGAQSKKAFTLIELSIVIVIISLIVTAVIGGQTLANQAKLRSIITEFDQIEAMTRGFELQYSALPGDMTNAHDYWGSDCDATASNCNGNGDRKIQHSNTQLDNEFARFWQHLSLAGFTDKAFDGVGRNTNCDEQCIYYSDFGRGQYFVFNHAGSTYSFRVPPFDDLALVIFSSGNQVATDSVWYPSYTIAEAKNIDTKVDNGVANTGTMIAYHDNLFGAQGCSAINSVVGGADFISANLDDDVTLRCSLAKKM